MPRAFGYIRVSTREQNEDRQLIALSSYQIPPGNLYIDKQSGKDFERPSYKRMIRRLRRDDCIIMKSIDRLGRNYEEIIEQWKLITKQIGADIVIIDMPLLDTRRDKDLLGTFISDIVLQVLSFVSETERAHIRQRQAEGIAAARQKGVKFGRPALPPSQELLSLIREWESKKITAGEAAARLHISTRMFYYKVQDLREKY